MLAITLIAFALVATKAYKSMRTLTIRLRHNARSPHGRQHAFERFGIPGIVVANDLLDEYGLAAYNVQPCHAVTVNKCDFDDNRIILSNHVYDGSTNVSVSIAAHEAAHAKINAETPWTATLTTRLTMLRNFLCCEVGFFLTLSIMSYGLGTTKVPLAYPPIYGAITLLVVTIAIGILTIADELRASTLAMSFIREHYKTGGRKTRRCSQVLIDALMTYVWTSATWVLGTAVVLSAVCMGL